MKSQPLFEGVGVALLTLFDGSGEVDAAATGAFAEVLVGLGVRAVVVAGSTGEAAALSPEERAELIRAVRKVLDDPVKLIAGTGAPSTRQAVALTRSALDEGADAVLTLSPPGAPDPRPYYQAVAGAAGGMPVLAYHWPAMSAPGIPVAMLRDLPVAGCKDSSGDAERLLETRAGWGGPLYVGSSALLAYAGGLGCAGAILALANADPQGCIAAFGGDYRAQLKLAKDHRQATADFPKGIKRLAASRFGTSTVSRVG